MKSGVNVKRAELSRWKMLGHILRSDERSPAQVGGGSTPKNPNPKWDFKLFLGFLGFLGFFRKRRGKYLSQHS